jgi:hypothetical protein
MDGELEAIDPDPMSGALVFGPFFAAHLEPAPGDPRERAIQGCLSIVRAHDSRL